VPRLRPAPVARRSPAAPREAPAEGRAPQDRDRLDPAAVAPEVRERVEPVARGLEGRAAGQAMRDPRAPLDRARPEDPPADPDLVARDGPARAVLRGRADPRLVRRDLLAVRAQARNVRDQEAQGDPAVPRRGHRARHAVQVRAASAGLARPVLRGRAGRRRDRRDLPGAHPPGEGGRHLVPADLHLGAGRLARDSTRSGRRAGTRHRVVQEDPARRARRDPARTRVLEAGTGEVPLAPTGATDGPRIRAGDPAARRSAPALAAVLIAAAPRGPHRGPGRSRCPHRGAASLARAPA
jgi:hypothetical protein